MKRFIKQVQKQAVFFPACRSRLVHRSPTTLNLLRRLVHGVGGSAGTLITFTFFLLTACPDPPVTTDCGAHQIEVNGDCECEEGYHWSEDKTKCLMDTTSHNFVWEIDTLGISGSLRDVQVIDENNIWVVGDFETDSGSFEIANWNGISWEYHNFENSGKIDGVYSFSENDIWFASGCRIYHWNGFDYEYLYECDYSAGEINTVSHIWGTSSSDIYFVGNDGSIIHYDGTSFTKMTSPTTQDLDGIVGVVDSETGEKRIWINGWSDYPNGGLLLQYNGTDWEIIWDDNNPFFEDSQYIEPTLHIPDEKYIIIYSGGHDNSILSVHEQNNINQYEILHYDYNGYIRSLAGDKVNDLIGVGDLTNAIHFNGSTVVQIDELENMVPAFRYYTVDSQDGIIVIVSDTPYVIRGYKIE